MAIEEHLKILEQGVEVWNQWRIKNPKVTPYLPKVNLSNKRLVGINLSHAVLISANLERADLQKSSLSNAILYGANCKGTNLANTNLTHARIVGANFHSACMISAKLNRISTNSIVLYTNENNPEDVKQFEGVVMKKANMYGVEMSEASLTNIDMKGVNLERAILFRTNFSKVNLTDANLSHSNLIETTFINSNIKNAIINHAQVYGISTWDLKGTPKEQNDLIITPKEQTKVTVDNLEIVQFIYLLLNNSKIRNIIDTITSKSVLILGRFYKERKDILDALKEELRNRNYVPILFDFEKPMSKDLTETVTTLAQMSRFIIADITDAKSIPQELMAIVPHNPSIPVASIISKEFREYAMYEHFESYPWVLPLYEYESKDQLLDSIKAKIIDPAENKANELRPK